MVKPNNPYKSVFLIKKLIFFFILCTTTIFAQSIQKCSEQIVLASKLNVRDAPCVCAKRLTQLPYETKVEVLEERVEKYCEKCQTNNDRWSKIKYDDKIGYVSEVYLGQPIEMVQYTSGSNTVFMRYKNWYRITPTAEGEVLEKIEVRLDSVYDEDRGKFRGWFIREKGRKKKDDYSDVWGTNLTFAEGKIGTLFKDCFNPKTKTYDEWDCNRKLHENLNNKRFFEKDTRFKHCFIEFTSKKVVFSNGNKTQTILEGDWGPTNFYVDWYGDLDMDGKPDFILSKSTRKYLFLSSMAEKGQLVKLVSVEFVEEGC
jgi:hypothetical protein